eukprot:152763-Pelagomonas_calceolata.AAC.4
MKVNFALIPELPSDARSSHPAQPRLRSADEGSDHATLVERAWSGGDLNLQAGMDLIQTGTLMEAWYLGCLKQVARRARTPKLTQLI